MYRIKGWNDNFEFNESRRLIAPARCAHPNRFGRGLRRLARLADGAMIYGLFVALCNVNSARRPEQRMGGWLSDDGTESGEAWTVEDFEDFTGFAATDFQRMVDVLESSRFGWLIQSPAQPEDANRTTGANPPATREIPPATRPTDRQTDRTEQTEQKEGKTRESPPPIAFRSVFASEPGMSTVIVDRDAIVSEINALRRQRDLSELVGHFAAVPVDRALREPGVSCDLLSDVVRYEFAKYDRAENPSSVLTHLEPGNMFRSEFLTGSIDRARRWSDDPDGYDWGASRDGISDAEWDNYSTGATK